MARLWTCREIFLQWEVEFCDFCHMYCSTKQFECIVLICMWINRNILVLFLQMLPLFCMDKLVILFGRAIQEGKNCTKKCITYPVFLDVLIEVAIFINLDCCVTAIEMRHVCCAGITCSAKFCKIWTDLYKLLVSISWHNFFDLSWF